MATPQKGNEATLEIRRTFKAPRAKVFAAWTEREKLERWMCRDVPTHDPKYLELDVRPGGSYRLSMADPDAGAVYTVGGEFIEVDPPRRLVYTWTSETPGSPTGDLTTLVTVEFQARGDQRTTSC